jgi:hypothetical protein
MFVRPNVRPDSARGDIVVHKGIPIADFGAVACTLNGVPVSYQEVESVDVTGSGLSIRKLVIIFRRGGSITFEGPRFGSSAIKTFVSQATQLANTLSSQIESRWELVVEKRLQEEHAFRVDDLRFLDSGELYDGDVFLANVTSPDCSIKVTNGTLSVLYRGAPASGGRASSEFFLGIAASPIQDVIRKHQRILREKIRDGSPNGLQERAGMAMLSLAAVVGAWQPRGFRSRMEEFCRKRSISMAKLEVKDIDYAALALDKRFLRNAYNTIADGCRYSEVAKNLRFNHLVDDLVVAAADGIRISKVAIYVIFEVAIYQGLTMSSVPPIIDRVLKLGGKGWIEVSDANWTSDPPKQPEPEEPPLSEKEARRQSYAYYDHSAPPPEHDVKPSAKPVEPEPQRWFFSESTHENFQFFGFTAAPTERELRAAFAGLLKKHHPDRIQMTGAPEEIAAATAMMQEINKRRDWLVKDLADYWAALETATS